MSTPQIGSGGQTNGAHEIDHGLQRQPVGRAAVVVQSVRRRASADRRLGGFGESDRCEQHQDARETPPQAAPGTSTTKTTTVGHGSPIPEPPKRSKALLVAYTDRITVSSESLTGPTEPPWICWRLGLVDSNQGGVGLLDSVERCFELCGRESLQ